ncbi:MAG: hydroxyacid dehydrogenase [Spirochaetales bacterium]|nr:hydroxyacid dehydrogenase [Spirochaetales bacterium]
MQYKSLIIMDPVQTHNIYGSEQVSAIKGMTDLLHSPMGKEEALARPDLLMKVNFIFSGWDSCILDETFLASAPELKAVFYGAGSVRDIVTPAFWNSGIPLTTAYAANAVPVAEFTFAQIIMALKKGQYLTRLCRENKRWEDQVPLTQIIPACYGSTVGLVSLGMIGSRVLDFLQSLDVKILVYDIVRNEDLASEKNFEYVSLETIFSSSDVVSLHTANLPSPRKMISAGLLASMKKGAALINTARGAIIDEEGMIAVLKNRPDLEAYLDVLTQDPPEADNPLLFMPNVYITPHIAGSMQTECRRMGQMAVEECRRFLAGEKPLWPVTEKMMETMA